MWLNIRTGYSFRKAFIHIDEAIKKCKKFAGIADESNTFGHVQWYKTCKTNNIEPILGVRLHVSDLHPVGSKSKRYINNICTFIAKNNKGLEELYYLVYLAHKQFYQFPKITYKQLNDTTKNLIVLSGIALEEDKIKRSMFLELSPNLPINRFKSSKFTPVACIDNHYLKSSDKYPYESFVDQYQLERKTSPMHLLTEQEWLDLYPTMQQALDMKHSLAKLCYGVELPKAPTVVYDQKINANKELKKRCKPKKLKGNYLKRFEREFELIKQKNYADYFLIVADIVKFGKTKMVVGPARGSAAGSLICYLLGITTIDPLKYDLLFERFIDVNRMDLPDIDIDFQDDKRHLIIKMLQNKYGFENVAQIANINKLKPKSAIIKTRKSLNIPPWEVEEFKESIEERPEGDLKARYSIKDAFKSDLGEALLKQHPNFKHTHRLEGHPDHMGIHAAGLLVCPEPIYKYCGINSKDNHIVMIDKRDAEDLNLLKIDALGLKTLTILANVCEQLNKSYSWIYKIPLNNKAAYKILNRKDLTGIFQMEGQALQELASQIKIKNIIDLANLSAICRPGPLKSGAAHKFIKQHSGKADILYLSSNKKIIEATKETFGNVIYQEQLMFIVREYGGFSWEDVTKIRKLMAKSQGDEAFGNYKKQFIKGASKNGASKKEALEVWEALKNFGQYGFNKSHAISYAILTYLTAYMKANHPLEFAVAILNNTSNDLTALKILRDLKTREDIDYKPYDLKHSDIKWTVHKNRLIGGFTSIEGIGIQKARQIINCRKEKKTLPAGLQKLLYKPKTPFKYLYPGKQLYGKFYSPKSKYGKATHISDLTNEGEYILLGMLTKKEVRDLRRNNKSIEGETNYLNMRLEDDTGSIDLTIGRYEFKEIASIVLDDSQINKDWFIVYGKYVKSPMKRVFVKDIEKITL